MRLQYVGDGARDHWMLPPLVEPHVGAHEVTFTAWHDIRLAGGGYRKKLLYTLIRAQRDGLDGMVAVVDEDGERGRLAELEQARRDRTIPVAIGEARPHGEAWLVDDVEALREVGLLGPSAPAPKGKRPKSELAALTDADPRDNPTLFAAIAARVRVERCRRAHQSGLQAFVDDLRAELSGSRSRRSTT